LLVFSWLFYTENTNCTRYLVIYLPFGTEFGSRRQDRYSRQ